MPGATNRRPASKAHQYILIESFEAGGLSVDLLVAGYDYSPRRHHLGRCGTIVCAEPYASALSDNGPNANADGSGDTLLADDAALALLLAAPLSQESLWVLDEHVRVRYGARVLLPLFVDEDAQSRTGVSLGATPGGSADTPAGVIFDANVAAGTSEVETKSRLLDAVAQFDHYLRGEFLLSVVQDDHGTVHWSSMTYDADLDALRVEAIRAANSCS